MYLAENTVLEEAFLTVALLSSRSLSLKCILLVNFLM